MSSSPSASPVSAGSDNSTDYFRDAVSQQLSLEGLPDDVSLIPSEALAYIPKPSDILKASRATKPILWFALQGSDHTLGVNGDG